MATSDGDISLTVMDSSEEIKQPDVTSISINKSLGSNRDVQNVLQGKAGKSIKALRNRYASRKSMVAGGLKIDLNEDNRTKDIDSDNEHWDRYEMSKGSYGGRSVGGKKPSDEKTYSKIEAIDYTTHDTVEESMLARLMIHDDPKAWCSRLACRRAQLWIMYIMIGAAVSGFIGFILYLCSLIEYERVNATKKVLMKGDIFGAWWTWTGSSLILCLIACACVLIEPAAASSGIPGLIAYLNGVKPKGGLSPITGKTTYFTSWETMAAKTIGMICSVPSGIAIGPEGPIIHISALIAHWTSKVAQELEKKIMPSHAFTSRESEERDFLATGAACGICTAFRAPLAGVMFVVEEASSFFTTTHLEFTFLACLVSYWVTWAFLASAEGDSTVKFKQTTGAFCTYHDIFDYAFFITIGIIGGCLGALFNQIVEHLNELRVEHINNHAWFRILEVIIVVLLTGTAAVCLPAAFMCKKELRSVMMEDSAGCLNRDDQFQLSHGSVSHPWMNELLHKASNCSANNITSTSLTSGRMLLASASSSSAGKPIVRPVTDVMKDFETYRVSQENALHNGVGDVVWLDNGKPYIHLHYGHMYTCDSNNHEYNEMSMLWLNGGVKAVKVILQRGFPHMLSWQVLLAFCIIYFFLAAITAGISVPAGLVVPMLLIGGSYGRLFGLGALSAKKSMCSNYEGLDLSLAFNDTYYWSTLTRWVVRTCRMPDPGTYAIVGAASFLGGSGRITVMLATVLLELTDDTSMIAPVGICCVLSMLVGNAFNHGLYHGLIPVFNIPYLNVDPPPESQLAQVKDVMNSTPIVVPKLIHITKLEELLDCCHQGDEDKKKGVKHHGFPNWSLEKCNDELDENVIYYLRQQVHYEPNVNVREAAIIVKVYDSETGIKPTERRYGIQLESGGTENHVVAKGKCLRKMKGITHHAFPVVSSITQDELGNDVGVLEGMISREELEYALVAAKMGDHTLHFVHLMKFCDRSPLTVYPNTRLSRAYSVFQKLGMRHLPVVSEKGLVKGILTRKNLMHYLLTDQKNKELIKIKRVQVCARLFLARRRLMADKYFESVVNKRNKRTKNQTLHLVDFNDAISKFQVMGEDRLLPEILEGAQLKECLEFIGIPKSDHVTKAEFRVHLSKARQWRFQTMAKLKKERREQREEENHIAGNENENENEKSSIERDLE